MNLKRTSPFVGQMYSWNRYARPIGAQFPTSMPVQAAPSGPFEGLKCYECFEPPVTTWMSPVQARQWNERWNRNCQVRDDQFCQGLAPAPVPMMRPGLPTRPIGASGGFRSPWGALFPQMTYGARLSQAQTPVQTPPAPSAGPSAGTAIAAAAIVLGLLGYAAYGS